MSDAGRLAGAAHALALLGIKVGCDLTASLGARTLSGPDPGALVAITVAAVGWVPALAISALYVAAMEPGLRPRWRPRAPLPLALLTTAGVLTIVAAVILAFLAGDATTPLDDAIRTPADRWAVAVFAVAVTPLVEEWFFRGFLYEAVASVAGEWGAVVIVGLVFGLFHGPQYAGVPAALAAVTLMGLVATWMRKVGGGVWPCVVFHAAYNVVGVALMFAAGGH